MNGAIIPMPLTSRSPLRMSGRPGLFERFPFGLDFGRSVLDDLADLYGQSGITINRTEDATTYSFNLAGFDEAEVSVKVDPRQNMLYVSAAHKDDQSASAREYQYPLEEESVTADLISKEYRNGLLSVTVRKPEQTQAETFEVKSISTSSPEASALTSEDSGGSS